MAAKNFRSTLLEPTSEFAKGDKLRFTALSTSGGVFNSSFSETVIGDSGKYSVDLQYGKYRIDYKPHEGCWQKFADVEVSASTLATSLQSLALSSKPVTDDTILTLQSLLADAEDSAASAAGQAAAAASSAAESKASADEAKAALSDVLSGSVKRVEFTAGDLSEQVILLHKVGEGNSGYFFGNVSAFRNSGIYAPFDCRISAQKTFYNPDESQVVMHVYSGEWSEIYLCYCNYNGVRYLGLRVGQVLSSLGKVIVSGEWIDEPLQVAYKLNDVVTDEAFMLSIEKIGGAVSGLSVSDLSDAEERELLFFESEKSIALQIMSDYQLGLYSITEQDITETRLYIQSIEPLAVASSQRSAMPRPQVFSRYKRNPYEL